MMRSLGCMVAGLTLVACAQEPDRDRTTALLQPDFPTYQANVDDYLNRRCGTLDCHGQQGRAYRIYGREGLRNYAEQDGGLISGEQPTTDAERRANFESIIGLEPEGLNRLIASQGSQEELERWVWLRKPLRLERHKGGPVMAQDDPGYRCVVAWLRVPVVTGTGAIVPDNQRVFSDRAKELCLEATSYP